MFGHCFWTYKAHFWVYFQLVSLVNELENLDLSKFSPSESLILTDFRVKNPFSGNGSRAQPASVLYLCVRMKQVQKARVQREPNPKVNA